jgi:IS30 family transposase
VQSLDFHRTKLDEKAHKKIYLLYDEGCSISLIARRFGVKWSTIFRVIQMRTAPDGRTQDRDEAPVTLFAKAAANKAKLPKAHQ